MNFEEKLKSIAERNGGIIETAVAAERGISRAMLSKLYKKNVIQRITRGQYCFPDEMPDEMLSISLRSDSIVFSHETALFLQGISDRTPFEHSITVPTGFIPSVSLQKTCKVYSVKPELFSLGKTKLRTPFGNKVPAYDLERTICDVIRSRSRLGSETFLSALKMYSASPRKDLNRLDSYAKIMKISGIVRKYLEVLL